MDLHYCESFAKNAALSLPERVLRLFFSMVLSRAFQEQLLIRQKQCKTRLGIENAVILPLLQYLGYDPYSDEISREVYPDMLGVCDSETGDCIFLVLTCEVGEEALHALWNSAVARHKSPAAPIVIVTDGLNYSIWATRSEEEYPIKRWSISKEGGWEDFDLLAKHRFSLSKILGFEAKNPKAEILGFLRDNLSNPGEGFVNFIQAAVFPNEQAPDSTATKEAIQESFLELVQHQGRDALREQWFYKKACEIIYDILRSSSEWSFQNEDLGTRTHKTYTSVLLKDNNRLQLCRFYTSHEGEQFIALLHGRQEVKKCKLAGVRDLWKYQAELLAQFHAMRQSR